MSRDTTHPLQPQTDHDGTSRRLAVLACKYALRGDLQANMRAAFERDPAHVTGSDAYRLWSGFNRASQDRMWSLLAGQIDADMARIDDVAKQARVGARGTLSLAECDSIPDYQHRAPIHGQPGGYMLDRGATDLGAGALYEAGGNLYAMGQGIGRKDSKGERLIAHIRDRFPDLVPRRILELGCSAGGQSTDYPAAFPAAECHAIDLAPGMLRYAHVRAELLGARIHFHQQDAAATTFPDGHFDLVVSHNLFHEVAAGHMPKILAECFRLLAPGGVCIHQDVPIQSGRFDAFMRFVSEWQVENNDEPFWMDFAEADLPTMMSAAGFAEDKVDAEYLEALDGPIPWYVVTAIR